MIHLCGRIYFVMLHYAVSLPSPISVDKMIKYLPLNIMTFREDNVLLSGCFIRVYFFPLFLAQLHQFLKAHEGQKCYIRVTEMIRLS